MAPHSSALAWKIPWTGEPGGLQSMGSLRVGHNWATSLSRTGEGNGNPLQYSCLENPRDGGAWWAAVYGVAQSWTRLTRLSSSSSSNIKLQRPLTKGKLPCLPPHPQPYHQKTSWKTLLYKIQELWLNPMYILGSHNKGWSEVFS